MIGSLAAAALAGVALARPRPEHVEEGLPPWMTHGVDVRLEIALNLLESQNTVGALEVLRLMRQDGFDDPRIDLYQGTALRMDGVTSEAERLLLEAQKRMRDDGRPSAQLCLLYADLHDVPAAITACERAVRLDDTDGKSANNLAYLLMSENRFDEALEAAEGAVQIDGANPIYRNNLGLVQASLGREDQAFRTLKSSMAPADAAYMVAIAVERARGLDTAQPWFERALELAPGHSLTLEHLAPAPQQTEPDPPNEASPGSAPTSDPAPVEMP